MSGHQRLTAVGALSCHIIPYIRTGAAAVVLHAMILSLLLLLFANHVYVIANSVIGSTYSNSTGMHNNNAQQKQEAACVGIVLCSKNTTAAAAAVDYSSTAE